MKEVAEFFSLVRQTEEASQACDMFDLRSDDPESSAAFRLLITEERRSARALIELVMKHGQQLLDEIESWDEGTKK